MVGVSVEAAAALPWFMSPELLKRKPHMILNRLTAKIVQCQ